MTALNNILDMELLVPQVNLLVKNTEGKTLLRFLVDNDICKLDMLRHLLEKNFPVIYIAMFPKPAIDAAFLLLKEIYLLDSHCGDAKVTVELFANKHIADGYEDNRSLSKNSLALYIMDNKLYYSARNPNTNADIKDYYHGEISTENSLISKEIIESIINHATIYLGKNEVSTNDSRQVLNITSKRGHTPCTDIIALQWAVYKDDLEFIRFIHANSVHGFFDLNQMQDVLPLAKNDATHALLLDCCTPRSYDKYSDPRFIASLQNPEIKSSNIITSTEIEIEHENKTDTYSRNINNDSFPFFIKPQNHNPLCEMFKCFVKWQIGQGDKDNQFNDFKNLLRALNQNLNLPEIPKNLLPDCRTKYVKYRKEFSSTSLEEHTQYYNDFNTFLTTRKLSPKQLEVKQKLEEINNNNNNQSERKFFTKKEVQVYDYVDLSVPMLVCMFNRQCKAYEAIGYRILLPASTSSGWPTIRINYNCIPFPIRFFLYKKRNHL